MSFRTERDTMGEMQVPADALYGASTARAVDNFPVALEPVPATVIHAFGYLKAACAQANQQLGKLDAKLAESIVAASLEVAAGKHDKHFPVDIYQTGSGTSTNMNANEVIANLSNEHRGIGLGAKNEKGAVHPNDHVNMGQSSNDTFPAAMHIAGAVQIKEKLIPALTRFASELEAKGKEWDDIVKIGRTHLMDATPIRVGQVFAGYAAQAHYAAVRAGRALARLEENMPIGGTAVGTGINTHPEFGKRTAAVVAKETGLPFIEAVNHFEGNAQRDGLVEYHGELKTVAVTLFNVSNNIRWLGSGPRCAFYEVMLPDRQPGSSIMPGKVNPVMCESMMQVTAKVMGNDQAIAVAGAAGGQFQLNIMMPMMGDTTLESISLLAGATNAFVDFCAIDMEANIANCEASVEKSLSMCTSLNPYIGYEKAAALAKEAFKSGKTIRQLCEEQSILPPEELKKALDPMSMTEPG